MGKITVSKSLAASQLVYVFSSLCTNGKFIKELHIVEIVNLFFSLLWNKKGDKIKYDTIINDYPKGGLKMIDIQSFNKSLKAMWTKNISMMLTKENGIFSLIFFYPDWVHKWVMKVKHLKDELDNFLTGNDFQTKYRAQVCLLKYFVVLTSVKALWNTCRNSFTKNTVYVCFFTNYILSWKSASLLGIIVLRMYIPYPQST